MSTIHVNIKQLNAAITDILGEYKEEVKEMVEEVARDTSKEAARKLKAVSPKLTGAYSKDWTSKKGGRSGKNIGYVVYNRKHYQVTHLLEYGHIVYKNNGVGHVPAHTHIKPIEEEANERFYKEVKARL